eukprot:CAMPEP_0172713714 /NCGR_PEP_ID=MMETSP1074-20121228/63469_1 /TAXON_ID=2916 /ORGANISM="Ceratium fusus, Strain PA161109" /LENGTH=59 /DNA_ID=CAMNT_0013537903 /DNA_START=127 /DNA_END=303 /DNA_ORIENTATION=+
MAHQIEHWSPLPGCLASHTSGEKAAKGAQGIAACTYFVNALAAAAAAAAAATASASTSA